MTKTCVRDVDAVDHICSKFRQLVLNIHFVKESFCS